MVEKKQVTVELEQNESGTEVLYGCTSGQNCKRLQTLLINLR